MGGGEVERGEKEQEAGFPLSSKRQLLLEEALLSHREAFSLEAAETMGRELSAISSHKPGRV